MMPNIVSLCFLCLLFLDMWQHVNYSRGARPSIKDGGGLTAMERTMVLGAITDEELFVLLAGS